MCNTVQCPAEDSRTYLSLAFSRLCRFGFAESSGGRNDGSARTVDCDLFKYASRDFDCLASLFARYSNRTEGLDSLDEFLLFQFDCIGWYGFVFNSLKPIYKEIVFYFRTKIGWQLVERGIVDHGQDPTPAGQASCS